MSKLMTRDEFREAVFERDNSRCVVCGEYADAAHHLYERKLWTDGGYYLDNGASLCKDHHIEAERTDLSIETLAELSGIKRVPLPQLLESGYVYDKWGNVLLPDGTRMHGLLSKDWSVQKILLGKTFSDYFKHPRTSHLPWSNPGKDDITVPLNYEDRMKVVITEKMDGENTTIYHNYLHTRSIDSGYHESRNWVKNFASKWQFELGPGMRVCGENLYALHSIAYRNLPSYFLGFSIWQNDICLSWTETEDWFGLLEIEPVRVLFIGYWDEAQRWCDKLTDPAKDLALFSDTSEGYVIRPYGRFGMLDYTKLVGKYVRPNHVTTDTHWRSQKVIRNELAHSAS